MPLNAKTLCGFDIGRDVINVKGFVGANFEGAQSFLVYEGIGFAGPDGAGIDAKGEEIEKAVVAFHVADMDGVGIGEEGKTVAFGKALDKRILLDGDWVEGAIPDFGELLKGKLRAEALIQMKIPVAGRRCDLPASRASADPSRWQTKARPGTARCQRPILAWRGRRQRGRGRGRCRR